MVKWTKNVNFLHGLFYFWAFIDVFSIGLVLVFFRQIWAFFCCWCFLKRKKRKKRVVVFWSFVYRCYSFFYIWLWHLVLDSFLLYSFFSFVSVFWRWSFASMFLLSVWNGIFSSLLFCLLLRLKFLNFTFLIKKRVWIRKFSCQHFEVCFWGLALWESFYLSLNKVFWN